MTEKKIDVYKLPAHEDAELFPMIPEEELQALAEDIKENGMHHPIVIAEVDDKLRLIDGRNRLAACKIAGIQAPEYKMLNGQDLTAYIISENCRRRHMDKGQMAMAEVIATKGKRSVGGRGKKVSTKSTGFSIHRDWLSKARTVYEYSPEIARKVLSGKGVNPEYPSLREAYEDVMKMKNEKQTAEERALQAIAEIRDSAPDLAEKVEDNAMSIDAAYEELKRRDFEQREKERAKRQSLLVGIGAIGTASTMFNEYTISEVKNLLENHTDEFLVARGMDGKKKLASELLRIEEYISGMRKLFEQDEDI